jgi:PAS domain S-box-containing protein
MKLNKSHKPASIETPPEEGEAIRVAARSDLWFSQYERGHGPHGSLNESLRYFTRVFEEAPAAYVITDANMLITNANAQAQRLFQRAISRLKGKPITLFIAESERDTFRRIIVRDVLDSREPVKRPLKLRIGTREGDVLFSASAMRNAEGSAECVAWIFHDRHDVEDDPIL